MILKRDIEESFVNWKQANTREPLVVFGPRQVGKTFAVRNFAKEHFANVHEVNFWKSEALSQAFLENGKRLLDPKKILRRLELLLGESIEPGSDLLFFDEIQDCSYAYEALKFFKEDIPALDIIATGSYLQLFLSDQSKITRHPVGSTKELWLHPLTFAEFLENANQMLYREYNSLQLSKDLTIDEILHGKLWEYLQYYFYTGGMPEVVQLFLSNLPKSLGAAAKDTRDKQLELINQYKNDLNKYAKNTDVAKIRKIFDSIPVQLNQYHDDPVGRFSFKEVAGKQGYRVLRSSFDYLAECRLIIKSFPIENPAHPLIAESKKEIISKFKAYFFDIGLLHASLSIPFANIVTNELGAYKGFLVENFVAQELFAYFKSVLYSFKNNGSSSAAEIEFLLTQGIDIIPIEVKSSKRYTRSKSLQTYISKFQPKAAYKLTPNRPSKGKGCLCLPVYLIRHICCNR